MNQKGENHAKQRSSGASHNYSSKDRSSIRAHSAITCLCSRTVSSRCARGRQQHLTQPKMAEEEKKNRLAAPDEDDAADSAKTAGENREPVGEQYAETAADSKNQSARSAAKVDASATDSRRTGRGYLRPIRHHGRARKPSQVFSLKSEDGCGCRFSVCYFRRSTVNSDNLLRAAQAISQYGFARTPVRFLSSFP